MKHIIVNIFTLLFIISINSCCKHKIEVIEEKSEEPVAPTYPTFSKPDWQAPNEGVYECSMTAIIVLSDSLPDLETASDCLAIFSKNECRGIGQRINVTDDKYVWLLFVMGNQEENNLLSLSVKKKKKKTKHKYYSKDSLVFKVDTRIGDIDTPATLNMITLTAEDNLE